MALEGLTVPVPTLFAADGALDPGKNARFVRDLSDAKVDHVFLLGSLGEFPSVTDDERPRLYEAVIDSITGKADAWVGCGAPSTRQAVRYAEEAESAGAAAIVAVPPYYLHPTLSAVEGYYRALHAVVKVPLLAYNIPSLVGYAMPPALLHNLFRAQVISGAKDTTGSLASIEAMIAGAPEGFVLLPGDDSLAAKAIDLGAQGAVMGVANAAPKLCGALVTAARSRDRARASELQALVDRIVEAVRAGPFPSTVKFLAGHLRGAEVGYRAPYGPLSAEEQKAVLERLEPIRERLQLYLGR
jgi:4-hydroxy-tetrahydrodipicolinate synthase